MLHPISSRKKALKFTAALFLMGLIILMFTDAWWPGIMLVIGIPLALRQYLLGRPYDTAVSLLVFCGTFITVAFDISWEIFLPTLFTLGAVYVFCREFTGVDGEDEEEREEDLNHEIEEK